MSNTDELSRDQLRAWSNRDLAVALKFLAMERGASGQKDSGYVALEAAERLLKLSSAKEGQ